MGGIYMAKIIADPLPEAGIKRLLRNQETLEYFKENISHYR